VCILVSANYQCYHHSHTNTHTTPRTQTHAHISYTHTNPHTTRSHLLTRPSKESEKEVSLASLDVDRGEAGGEEAGGRGALLFFCVK
jgi:hypothetical protein